jgi:hypothetical protein
MDVSGIFRREAIVQSVAVWNGFHRMITVTAVYACSFVGCPLLGWTWLLLFATLALVVFFGTLCILKEQEYCERLTSEIMCTSYAITGVVFMIGLTSYFRHRIPYEIFYAVHHLLFILYIVTYATEQHPHTDSNFPLGISNSFVPSLRSGSLVLQSSLQGKARIVFCYGYHREWLQDGALYLRSGHEWSYLLPSPCLESC